MLSRVNGDKSVYRELTDIDRNHIRTCTDAELVSIINLGLNGHPNFWIAAVTEARNRMIYFK